MRKMPQMRETTVVTPDSVWATSVATTSMAPEATARVAAGVPETIVMPPVKVAWVTTTVPETTRVVLVVEVETLSDSAAGQTGSRRGHWLWSAQQESQL